MTFRLLAAFVSLMTCCATLLGSVSHCFPVSCGPTFIHEGGGADPWYCLHDGVYYYC